MSERRAAAAVGTQRRCGPTISLGRSGQSSEAGRLLGCAKVVGPREEHRGGCLCASWRCASSAPFPRQRGSRSPASGDPAPRPLAARPGQLASRTGRVATTRRTATAASVCLLARAGREPEWPLRVGRFGGMATPAAGKSTLPAARRRDRYSNIVREAESWRSRSAVLGKSRALC